MRNLCGDSDKDFEFIYCYKINLLNITTQFEEHKINMLRRVLILIFNLI